MPSNKKKSNADDDDDLKQEGQQKLQAVLLADAVFGSKVTGSSDDQSFGLRPWSSDVSTSSQILCPINNVPLIDYILDFLSSNGVEQVIIVIGTCAGSDDALEDYLMNNYTNNNNSTKTKKKKQRHNFELLFLKDTSLTNAGDALRELYKRSWIRPSKQALPFLLVSGDVIADIDLREAMKAHKQRHSHDSAALMTVVLKPVQSSTTTNNNNNTNPSVVPRASDLVVGLVKATAKTAATVDAQAGSNSSGKRGDDSSSTNNIDENNDYRVMMYDNRSSQKSGVTLPCTFLTQSQSSTGGNADGGLVVRTDLMDTGIAICSPDVLGRLEDEFDYLDIAHDFVTNSVAEEEDGLQTRVYAHVLENNGGTDSSNTRNYAARAVDFQTYHAISKDLLKRWAYPTVADRMVTTTTTNEDGSNNNNEDRLYKLVRVVDHHRTASSQTKYGSTFAAKAAADRARRYSDSGSRPRPLQSLENSNNPLSPKNNNNNKDGSSNTGPHCYNNNNQYQYKEMLHPTKVGRTSIVHGPGMMGSHGTIGEDCVVIRCVLGDNIQIDNNSTLEDCHLMDGVVVEAYVNMDSCLIARNAVIKEGVTLGNGCVIGEGCVIGKGSKLPPFTRITLAKDDDDDGLWGDDEGYGDSSDDDDSTTDVGKSKNKDGGDDNDHNVVGRDGIGRVWRPTLDDDGYDNDDDDVDDDQDPFENLMNLQSIGGDPTSYYLKREQRLIAKEEEEYESDGFSDHDDDEDDDMMMAETQAFSKFTEGTVTFGHEDDDINNNNSFGATAATTTAPDVIGRQKGVDVIKEMTDICMEFDDEFHPFENLAIELNSFKFSQNATYGDCVTAAMSSLLCKMKLSTDMTDGRLVSLLKTKLDKFWTGMLQRLCVGIPEELSILYALENAATVDQTTASKTSSAGDSEEATENKTITTNIAQKLRSGMSFRFVLQTLHSQEVLSEEAILLWAEEHREDNNDDDPRSKLFMMQSVQDFLEWLEQESEDEDDSDDDSDGEDSDED
jgi:NDP-sugar pyrophosphorylase family protein